LAEPIFRKIFDEFSSNIRRTYLNLCNYSQGSAHRKILSSHSGINVDISETFNTVSRGVEKLHLTMFLTKSQNWIFHEQFRPNLEAEFPHLVSTLTIYRISTRKILLSVKMDIIFARNGPNRQILQLLGVKLMQNGCT